MSMKCVICFDNMKAEGGGQDTNWSQRCISCKDSWICGSCYHKWDSEHSDCHSYFKTMPCVICKKDMDYSHLVNRWCEGNGAGWWDQLKSPSPLWKMIDRNCNL